MAKPKILQLGTIDLAHDDWTSLAQVADIIMPQATDPVAFAEEMKSGAFDDVVVIYRTFQSTALTGSIDDRLIELFPPSIKFICHYGAGYDQVDVDACTARNIRVSNVPGIGDDATADLTVFLIIGALRQFSYGTLALRRGEFKGTPVHQYGRDPRGKILGILGMGQIGRNVMTKAKAFGMIPQYHNRMPLSDELSDGAQYVSFDELLRTSDVLSLNLPLNAKTHHLISTKEFSMMKKGVVIVNTARGPVMDSEALRLALDCGQVFSAGLDVYDQEPHVPQWMIDNPYIFLLPHMGTSTLETQTKMEAWNIANARSAAIEGKLLSPVPEQKHLHGR